MPYTGPGDLNLPDRVKKMPEKKRAQWVEVWNSTYESCIDKGGDADDCESDAYRNAYGVVKKNQDKTFTCECLECGHIWESAEHCDEAECPECGADNARRAERPGAGQPSNNLRWFATNEIAATRRERVDDVEYLVAPVVIIREGVLNGELVRASEFGRHYESWNGRPFVINHPRDNDGNPVTANDPLTLAGKNPNVCGGLKVGELYNTEPHEDRLRSEVWIPIERTEERGGEALEVLERLERQERMEVSTGYWRDLDLSPGEWDGRPYAGMAMNLKPDHVAGLTDAVGACSWDDGCGAPRLNEEEDMELNVLSSARRPTYSSKSSGSWSRPSLKDFGIDKEVSEMSSEEKNRVAKTSLLGDPSADNFRDLCFFPVVSPKGALNENALDAVISGRGAQANIPADAKKSAQSMARRLLNEEFDRDLEREQARNSLLTFMSAVANLAEWLRGEAQQANENEEVQVDERERLIQELLENTELSEEELQKLSDCSLKALAALVEEPEEGPEDPEEPAAQEGSEEPETNAEPGDEEEYVSKSEHEALLSKMGERIDALEAELRKDETQRHNELVQTLAANDRCAVSREKLEAMDVETLESIQQSLVPPDYRGAGGGPQGNEGQDWVVYDRDAVLGGGE